jgi:branched-chain amino acid transport system substrate-binding protein
MSLKKLGVGFIGAAIAVSAVAISKAEAEEVLYLPNFVYRSGPYAPNGIPFANGARDFVEMVNKRDGGVQGVKLVYEECETGYDTKLIVECYERLKNKNGGVRFVHPNSTGATYQLIPKSGVDKVVVHSMGYGMTAAADGRVFPWVFNFPTTYWSQASAFIRHVASEEGGMDQLAGKKIALIYHNSPYGKEPIPTLRVLAEKHGYELLELAVDHPGQEQKATWLQIRKIRPDWTFLWGWGVMNQVAIKEAAAIKYPMDHFIGVWWSGTESDVVPTGDAATGYKAGTFHAPGHDTRVHEEILKHVYEGDLAEAKKNNFGEVLYNRSIVGFTYGLEAINIAMNEYGKGKVPTKEQVRWGFENLSISEERLAELGLAGFTRPLNVSCADHEGNGPVLIQQWDGSQWQIVTDWIPPIRDVVRPMIEQAAAKFAKENAIQPRSC